MMQFHSIAGSIWSGTDDQAMQEFQEGLINKGVISTMRESLEEDISDACGMLNTKELINE